MKAKTFVTLKDGQIVERFDCSSPVELKDDQMVVTPNELAMIRICDGDLQFAKNIIRDIEERIAKKTCTIAGEHEWETVTNGEYTKTFCKRCGLRS